METTVLLINQHHLERSYRTYEEWKRGYVVEMYRYLKGSYRTYEEWKHESKNGNWYVYIVGSYRTYEEWKLIFSLATAGPRRMVLTVPMRNGNMV